MIFENPRIQHLSDSKRAVGMFPQSPGLVRVVGNLEGRSIWLKSGALSFIASKANIRDLQTYFQTTYGKRIEIIGGTETKQAKELTVEYTPVTEPYEHQERALEFLENKTSACIFAEQGTGKSKIAIDHFCKLFLNGEIDCVVIVAPKGVDKLWIDSELEKHCGIDYEAYHFTGKPKSFLGRDTKKLTIITMTYGKLGSKSAIGFVEYLKMEFANIMFVMDESHFIKSPATNRWKACYKFSQNSAYRLALTGTPIAKKLTDEWAQLKCVDEDVIGIESQAAFERRFVFTDRQFSYYSSSRRKTNPIDQFKALTADAVFRCTKAELNISPKTYSNWAFNMTHKQQKLFRQVAYGLRCDIIEKQLSLEFACMALIKLRQIGCGFIIDKDKTVHRIMPTLENPRIQELQAILEGYAEEPIIIWSHHIEDSKQIRELLENMRETFVVYGGSTEQRLDSIDRFNSGEARIFSGNPASGGTGVNLQHGGCRLAIYYSHSDNSIERWQSEDRIHRIGQKGICEYINMIANGSTDTTTLRRTAMKKRLADYTLDDILQELEGYVQ